MSTPHESTPKHRSRASSTIQRILRARITAGLVVVLPIWITILLLKFLFGTLRDASFWLVLSYLETERGKRILESWGRVSAEVVEQQGLSALPPWVQWLIAILCVLLTVFFLYAIGLLTANFVGKRIMSGVEQLVDRLPLIKTVYRACKQILEAFAGESKQEFQRVVLVPFPCMEIRTVGFITSINKDLDTGEDICSVFLATTPNPTTGYVLILRRSDLIELDWSVEEAISVVMSGGAMTPARVPLVRGIPPALRAGSVVPPLPIGNPKVSGAVSPGGGAV